MDWYDWLICAFLLFSINGKSKDADFNFALTIAIGMLLCNS